MLQLEFYFVYFPHKVTIACPCNLSNASYITSIKYALIAKLGTRIMAISFPGVGCRKMRDPGNEVGIMEVITIGKVPQIKAKWMESTNIVFLFILLLQCFMSY